MTSEQLKTEIRYRVVVAGMRQMLNMKIITQEDFDNCCLNLAMRLRPLYVLLPNPQRKSKSSRQLAQLIQNKKNMIKPFVLLSCRIFAN